MEAPPCMPNLSARHPWWQQMRKPGDDGSSRFSGVLPIDLAGDDASTSEDPFSSYISRHKQVLPRLRTALAQSKGTGRVDGKDDCELAERKPSRTSTFSGFARASTKPAMSNQVPDYSMIDSDIWPPGAPPSSRDVVSSRSGSRHLGTRQKHPPGKILPSLTSTPGYMQATSSIPSEDKLACDRHHAEDYRPRAGTANFSSSSSRTAAVSMACDLAARYANPMGKLQASHAEWRRKHDALVRRKKSKENMDRGASLASSEAVSAVGESAISQNELPRSAHRDIGIEDRKAKMTPMIETSSGAEGGRYPDAHGVNRQNTSTASMFHGAGESPSAREKSQPKLQSRSVSKSSSMSLSPRNHQNRGSQSLDGHGVASRKGISDEVSSMQEDDEEERNIHKTEERSMGKEQTQEAASTVLNSLSSLKAGKPFINRRTAVNNEAFDRSVAVAKANNLPVDQVHAKWDDFIRFDTERNGTLSEEEFEAAVREICSLAPDAEVPEHLLKHAFGGADEDNDGKVTFEEFVVWSIKTAYTEEFLVPDKKERELRLLARTHGFCLTDVERIKEVFDKFDVDHSGEIDEVEFVQVLYVFMKVKNPADVSEKKMKRYWREVDIDGSGTISFEEFLLWYYRCFIGEMG